MDMNLSQQIKTFPTQIRENEVGIQNDCGKALEIGDLFGKYSQVQKPRNKVFSEIDLNANYRSGSR